MGSGDETTFSTASDGKLGGAWERGYSSLVMQRFWAYDVTLRNRACLESGGRLSAPYPDRRRRWLLGAQDQNQSPRVGVEEGVLASNPSGVQVLSLAKVRLLIKGQSQLEVNGRAVL